ncbi:efflux transporter periplasmic adaptor subunit, partial [Herbaspirillum sp. HC18]
MFERSFRRPAAVIMLCAGLAMAGCNDRNAYQPPPPAEVTVAKPQQRAISRYISLTGQTAASLKVDLV